jgi:hypothetical protein
LPWKQLRTVIQLAVAKDQIGMLEQLVILAVKGSIPLDREHLVEYDGGFIWELILAALDENNLKPEETTFLSNSPSEDPRPSQKTAT